MATVEQAAATITVENPATGQAVQTVPVTAPEAVPVVMADARAAQPGWEALGYAGRGKVLRRAQRWLLDHADEVADAIVSETGKTREDALLVEVAYGAYALGFWPKRAPKYLADQKVRTHNPLVLGRRMVVRYRPVGVVGVIGPWNYPLVNSVGDAIPPLAAGNALVLKPASLPPPTSLVFERASREPAPPGGIFQAAAGRADPAEAIIDEADMVMFTGSAATGRKVRERAARTLTPVSLELGGKDPMIVCADADIERSANAAVHYSMQNAGQSCTSTERVYVEEPIYDEFVRLVTDRVRELRQSAPGGPGSVDLGAVISPPQSDIIERHVNDAVEKGARVLAGGKRRDEGGHFFEPTVLVDVDHSMACMKEETFGPTVPIMKVRDAEEAVRLANDTPFGLQASVWTKDTGKGERLARRIEAGAVTVNDAMLNYVALELPMGGWKESGLGTRHGADGIRKYTKKQSLLVTKFAPMKKDLHMLPYSEKRTRFLKRLLKLVYGR